MRKRLFSMGFVIDAIVHVLVVFTINLSVAGGIAAEAKKYYAFLHDFTGRINN